VTHPPCCAAVEGIDPLRLTRFNGQLRMTLLKEEKVDVERSRELRRLFGGHNAIAHSREVGRRGLSAFPLGHTLPPCVPLEVHVTCSDTKLDANFDDGERVGVQLWAPRWARMATMAHERWLWETEAAGYGPAARAHRDEFILRCASDPELVATLEAAWALDGVVGARTLVDLPKLGPFLARLREARNRERARSSWSS
jgi:hypothetical protein